MYIKLLNESGFYKDQKGNGFNILYGENFETPNGKNVGFIQVESIEQACKMYGLTQTENITNHIEVVEIWAYPDRPIKMTMSYKQATKLAQSMPEFSAMAKSLNMPFVENENGIDYYFEFILPEHRIALENFSIITEK